jgi:hypothetical protein
MRLHTRYTRSITTLHQRNKFSSCYCVCSMLLLGRFFAMTWWQTVCIVFCTKRFFVRDQGNLAYVQSPLCSFLSLCSVCHHRYDHYPPQPLVVENRSCSAQAITLVERRLLLRFTQHHHRSRNYIFHTTIWLDPDKTINCKNLPYIP